MTFSSRRRHNRGSLASGMPKCRLEVTLLTRGPQLVGGWHRAIPRTEREALDAVDPRDEDDPYEETPLRRVYFLLDRDACQVKIGITGNLDKRIATLSQERHRPLELLGSMRGGYDLERAMHGRFRDYRVERNEWYSSEIVGELAGLLAA